jgi:UDP-N-acetylglucosamine--N-acetylmuramyl-(pentapeptide) pyrophosphoryl-undecaprenol N-acetylglucosamine transferase
MSKFKLLVSGGGTGGSVSPVLGVVEEVLKLKPKTEIMFVGTRKGPEKTMVKEMGLKFASIPSAKFRRYFSLRNISDIFVFGYAFFRALYLVKKFNPAVVFSVGSFVSVPICWAGKLLGAKIVIHQQDARVGLANKLVAPFADKITTAFEFTAKSFYSGSGLFTRQWKTPAEWTGNPVRSQIKSIVAPKQVKLKDNLPLLFVLGGATGSRQINTILERTLPVLIKSYQVVHVTGTNKHKNTFTHSNYQQFELLPFDDYAYVLQKADLVLSRAGLSTITELSTLGKVSIVIPMPNSHQEDNAALLHFTKSAIIMDKVTFTSDNLLKVVNKLTYDPDRQKILSKNISRLMPQGAAQKIAQGIIENGGVK